MIMFVKVLQNILFAGGFIAIRVLAAVISALGKPGLGVAILVVVSALALMLAVATGIANTRRKRAVKAAQKARAARVSIPATTYSARKRQRPLITTPKRSGRSFGPPRALSCSRTPSVPSPSPEHQPV
ncbi:hypothetical protein [Arthrobacter sp. GAS37]|uniref:hypothetical protein n=1 Tax=Arthrobacter sp. GAS37 TaxID=3156261 RepID=UPI00384D5E72